jgi:copper(I)-binding protein
MPALAARHRRRSSVAVLFAAPLLALTACGAGQDAGTLQETPDPAGVDGGGGTFVLDDVFIQSDTAVAAGASVPLRAAFTNQGRTPESLVRATTPAAASVQLLDAAGHPSPQGITIPADGQVDAVTGAVRLRLVGVTSPIAVTTLVPMTFLFSDTRQVTLDVPVATADEGNSPTGTHGAAVTDVNDPA